MRTLQKGFRRTGNPDLVSDIVYFSWLNHSHYVKCYLLGLESNPIFAYRISYYKDHVSESFIRKFQNMFDWHLISWNYQMSESFIREFQDKVYWYYISQHQKLSEPFIIEFQDKVCWNWISRNQKLSKNFKIKYSILRTCRLV